jgi:hypothetical protein
MLCVCGIPALWQAARTVGEYLDALKHSRSDLAKNHAVHVPGALFWVGNGGVDV